MTQGELEKLPLPVARAFCELERQIMNDVIRRIRINGFSSASADWQLYRLQQLGALEEEIRDWIGMTLGIADSQVKDIFSDTAYSQYMGHSKAFQILGMKQVPFEENRRLQQLISSISAQTTGTFDRITGSMGFVRQSAAGSSAVPLTKYYTDTLDRAMYQIHSGAFDYQTVLARTINEMTRSGLRWIDYSSGVHNRVEVAARRAVMTGFRQIQGLINEHTAKELGTDSYEVTWHAGARPTHQPWQGKVWTMKQLQSVCGLGEVTGLHGANCYHDYNPFIPGVSVRTYTDDWLDAQNRKENTPKTYLGKQYTTYEALQRQRRMETVMRKYRRDIELMKTGGAPDYDIVLKQARYQGKMQEYRAFSKSMGLRAQVERVYQDGLGRVKAAKVFLRKSLGSGESNGVHSGKPILLGGVDLNNRYETIEYYNELIRNADIEYAVIVDRKGNVYYSVGDRESVDLSGVDLSGAIITHNHPISGGIVSFGKDDFEFLRDNQDILELQCVNLEYDYKVSILRDISNVVYNDIFLKGLDYAENEGVNFDVQDAAMRVLLERGYVRYEKIAINTRTEN